MKIFVLIFFFQFGAKTSAVSHDFDTEKACENALHEVSKMNGFSNGVCVPRRL